MDQSCLPILDYLLTFSLLQSEKEIRLLLEQLNSESLSNSNLACTLSNRDPTSRGPLKWQDQS